MTELWIPIQTYEVRVGRDAIGGNHAGILINDPVPGDWSRQVAVLVFRPTDSPQMGRIYLGSGDSGDGFVIVNYFSLDMFDRCYDLLRNESPLELYCDYTPEPPDQDNYALGVTAFTTGKERPGEGPFDLDHLLQMFEG